MMSTIATLCTKHFLDGVARHGVEEKRQYECKEYEKYGFEDNPFVISPQNIANRLQRAQEPNKGRIRSTEK